MANVDAETSKIKDCDNQMDLKGQRYSAKLYISVCSSDRGWVFCNEPLYLTCDVAH